jgi:hypothetical protein
VRLSYFLGRAHDDVNDWKAVGDELAGATLVQHEVALEIGDDKQIDVTTEAGGPFGVRTKEHNALGSKGTDETL